MILNQRSDEVYDSLPGVRSSYVKLAEDGNLAYRRELFPSYVDLALRPKENEKEHFILGNAVDERLSFGTKTLWKGLPKKLTSGSYKATRQRCIGICRSAMALMRKEYGDWKSDSYRQFVISTDVETEHGILTAKMKGDWLREDYVDWKTTRAPDDPLRELDKYRYDLSACHYSSLIRHAGHEFKRYRLLYVDSRYPFEAQFFDLPLWLFDTAYPRWKKCMNHVARGINNNDWFKGESPQDTSERPTWHAYKYETEWEPDA